MYDENDPIRVKEWQNFAELVEDHIINYTIPQYGDYPDNVSKNWGVDYIKAALDRYTSRIGKNVRGDIEAIRDCLKIAHYACMLHNILVSKSGGDSLITIKYDCELCGVEVTAYFTPDDVKKSTHEYLLYKNALCEKCYNEIGRDVDGL